jgi:putative ATP-binding cassette transporter
MAFQVFPSDRRSDRIGVHARAGFLSHIHIDPGRFGFLGAMWSLARPFWLSPDQSRARLMLALLLAIKGAGVLICVRQNEWYADFYTALQSREVTPFLQQIATFVLIAGGFVVSLVASHWVAEGLKMRWRDWLVRRYTADWLSRRAYYRLQLDQDPDANPDQRIVEDLGCFAGQTINVVVGFLDVSLSLAAFTGVLWRLSGTLTIGWLSVSGYMVFAVYGYTVLASWLTHRIGLPLASLLTRGQTVEGDFRYGLVRLRENAETVAFYRGEAREAQLLQERWLQVASNGWDVLRRQSAIGWFSHSHGQVSIVLPFLLSAPRYFTGQITFAEVMQVTAASGALQACLNFFIASYGQIAQWRATTERLVAFRARLDLAVDSDPSEVTVTRDGAGLSIRDLTLSLPDRSRLVDPIELDLRPGEAVLIKGPSGTGKSTMLRAIAGLWPHASGRVEMGPGDAFFVPQRPYLPLGSLREAAFYPAPPRWDDAEIREVLEAVGLTHLMERLDDTDQWSQRLSGGEQQRLGFARIFLSRPQTVFLDEATSALDEALEARIYRMLRASDWKPTVISIGHRSTLEAFHDRVIELVRARPDPTAPETAGGLQPISIGATVPCNAPAAAEPVTSDLPRAA